MKNVTVKQEGAMSLACTVLKGTAREVRDTLERRSFDADDLRELAADLRKDADELERIAKEEME